MSVNKQGFTLVELLIVIAVVGILAAVILVTINPMAQMAKARDASRIGLMHRVKSALDIYNIDYGKYPITGEGGDVGMNLNYPNCASFTDWSQGWIRRPAQPFRWQGVY